MKKVILSASCIVSLLGACGRVDHLGKAPDFTPPEKSAEHTAMLLPNAPVALAPYRPTDTASLWSADRRALLSDRRAMQRGDILTVVIEIDDKAEISNSSVRSRSGEEKLSIPNLLGLPQRVNPTMPAGASLDNAVGLSSQSKADGRGSVRRKEKLMLRIAATVVEALPNGVLSIQGRQEVRVNNELRELLVSGYVRPVDISRRNEITYDKIASARISYGGRGHISDMQQARYGQQILDGVLPF